jgi:ElaB/YqjD/DUF883 family membrane-anchored ribosome-binding protein
MEHTETQGNRGDAARVQGTWDDGSTDAGAADRVKQKLAHAGEAAKEKIVHGAEHAKERLVHVGETAKHKLDSARATTSAKAHDARVGVEHRIQAHPLKAVGIAFGAGALLGLLLRRRR